MNKTFLHAMLVPTLLLLGGCESPPTNEQWREGIGTATGAVVGGVAGHYLGGGSAAATVGGAAAGAIIGNQATERLYDDDEDGHRHYYRNDQRY